MTTPVVDPVNPTPAPAVDPTPAPTPAPAAPVEPEPTPALEKALKEKKNAMTRIAELEAQVQAKTDAELKAKEDYKTLYETSEQKYNDALAKLNATNERIETGHKTSALQKELVNLGADKDSIDFLLTASKPLIGELKYDDEHKVVMGVDAVAQQIKQSIPKAFGATPAGANHDAPTSVPASVDLDTYKKMSLADRKKNQAALFANKGITLKS